MHATLNETLVAVRKRRVSKAQSHGLPVRGNDHGAPAPSHPFDAYSIHGYRDVKDRQLVALADSAREAAPSPSQRF